MIKDEPSRISSTKIQNKKKTKSKKTKKKFPAMKPDTPKPDPFHYLVSSLQFKYYIYYLHLRHSTKYSLIIIILCTMSVNRMEEK